MKSCCEYFYSNSIQNMLTQLPMSICSTAPSIVTSPADTVCEKGYRLQTTRLQHQSSLLLWQISPSVTLSILSHADTSHYTITYVRPCCHLLHIFKQNTMYLCITLTMLSLIMYNVLYDDVRYFGRNNKDDDDDNTNMA